MICKSKNEIFGGYTPLSFSTANEYGCDNHSFLFSLTRLEKYPKDSFNRLNLSGNMKIMVLFFIMIYVLDKIE